MSLTQPETYVKIEIESPVVKNGPKNGHKGSNYQLGHYAHL